MKNLHPGPPHAIAALHSERPEHECFAEMCVVVADCGSVTSGTVAVVPWDATFEYDFDVAEVTTVLDLPDDRFHEVVGGRSDAGRPIQAGYRRKALGVILVEYLPALGGDAHAIGVTISAQTSGDATRGLESSAPRWLRKVLSRAAGRLRAPYGGIDVEQPPASPRELSGGLHWLPYETYISQEVVDADEDLREALAADFQTARKWPTGMFYAGTGDRSRSSRALGRHLHEAPSPRTRRPA
ncbi:hypothetical protein [Herbidospora mongoliensis]|uniref:hypothetical protein n=1 Tax=Herbidospora mongoliensis TaxID=688067 RepID=UPI000834A1E7|nr:hypothetical protein [Herbidospora mongoliensis]